MRAIAGRMRENATICGVGGRAHEGGRRVMIAGMLALRTLLERLPPLPESIRAANEAKKAMEAAGGGGANGEGGPGIRRRRPMMR